MSDTIESVLAEMDERFSILLGHARKGEVCFYDEVLFLDNFLPRLRALLPAREGLSEVQKSSIRYAVDAAMGVPHSSLAGSVNSLKSAFPTAFEKK